MKSLAGVVSERTELQSNADMTTFNCVNTNPTGIICHGIIPHHRIFIEEGSHSIGGDEPAPLPTWAQYKRCVRQKWQAEECSDPAAALVAPAFEPQASLIGRFLHTWLTPFNNTHTIS